MAAGEPLTLEIAGLESDVAVKLIRTGEPTPTATPVATATPSMTASPTANPTATWTLTPTADAHADANRDAYADGNHHAHADGNRHPHVDANRHTHADGNRHTHADGNRHTHVDANRHTHADGNALRAERNPHRRPGRRGDDAVEPDVARRRDDPDSWCRPQSGWGVAILASWSDGSSASCTTGTTGACSVSRNLSSVSYPSITFTVDRVARSGYTYDAAANHDPDGDSDSVRIVIAWP